jgi:hypothetical protein
MAFSIDIDFDYFYKLNPSPLFDPATPNGKAARDTVRKAANDWAKYIDSILLKSLKEPILESLIQSIPISQI